MRLFSGRRGQKHETLTFRRVHALFFSPTSKQHDFVAYSCASRNLQLPQIGFINVTQFVFLRLSLRF